MGIQRRQTEKRVSGPVKFSLSTFSVFRSDVGHDSASGSFFLWCLLATARSPLLADSRGCVFIYRPVAQYPRLFLVNLSVSKEFFVLTDLVYWDGTGGDKIQILGDSRTTATTQPRVWWLRWE
jgi:hypothetical protein